MNDTQQHGPAETTAQGAPILVLGASGKTGSRIAEILRRHGLPVREAGRRTQPRFDWDQPETWPAVFAGVEVAYICYYPDLASPGSAAHITAVTAAMHAAGVRSVVLLSGRGEAGAEAGEQIVRRSGLAFTLVRASWFTQNFTEGHLSDAARYGVLALPAGAVREPFVDVDDIAEVAAAALEAFARRDERHSGALYEVTGPRLLSFAEVATELARASGRPVEYQSMGFAEYRAMLTEAVGPELAGLFTELCREVFDGRNEHTADGVQRALGRAPRDFADTIAAAARAGAWVQAAGAPAAGVPAAELAS